MTTTNMPPYPLTIPLSMTNHDCKSFINVPMGRLPHFDGTNFAKWKHLMRAYLIGLHPDISEVVCNGFEPPVDPKNPTMEEMRIIHLNGQATMCYLVLWMVMSTIE
jgi:hypothetical protein